MIWQEIVSEYGESVAEEMKHSSMLTGITVTKRGDEWDIPREDVERAYRDVKGEFIHPLEMD